VKSIPARSSTREIVSWMFYFVDESSSYPPYFLSSLSLWSQLKGSISAPPSSLCIKESSGNSQTRHWELWKETPFSFTPNSIVTASSRSIKNVSTSSAKRRAGCFPSPSSTCSENKWEDADVDSELGGEGKSRLRKRGKEWIRVNF